MGELGAADGAAGFGLRLEDEHAASGVGEQVGGHEAVGPRPDHDRVDVSHHLDGTPQTLAHLPPGPAADAERRPGMITG